jgi:subtilisin family serine protease
MRRESCSSDATSHGPFRGLWRDRRGHSPVARRSRRASASLTVLAAAFALAFALPNAAFAVGPSLTPTGAQYAQQWALRQIGAANAWNYSTGQGVTIGLVDTGVDLQQQDLQGQILATTNCIGANANPANCSGSGMDDNGHGTHVAGIMVGTGDGGQGTYGVAPNAKLVVAKALDSTGAGADADVQAGIMWVVQHGARIVNLSLGDGSTLPLGLGSTGGITAALTAGIDYAWQNGAIPVLAAGNNGSGLGSSLLLGSLLGSTAAFGTLPAVIVGASTPTGAVASYSSQLTNDQWAILAPGGANDGNPADDVLSTYWTPSNPVSDYTTLAGTSMATPHVSGTLADLLAEGYSAQGAINQLLSSADKSVPCGSACSGLLDTSRAVGGPATPAPSGGGTTGAATDPISALLAALGL